MERITNINTFSRKLREHNFYIILTLLVFLIAGCSPNNPVSPVSQPANTQPAVTAQVTPAVKTTQLVPAALTTPVSVNQTDSLPTPDNRMKPEKWQEWPVVPQVSGHLKEIYQQGLKLGNDPNHFSRIGDCQSIQEALLGMFEVGKPYYLPETDKELEKTITQFAGSFGRDGQAVQGGFNAASVLSPLWANPDVCRPGETPLECELRVYQPSFVIISLEISWPGRTTETYEKYMRQIIDKSIARGVIPILVTKADNVEGDHSINLATARLAYEYDLPLVNWWLDAQGMPNKGMDPERNDGFHISMDAWRERSFQVLKTLDHVWRSVSQAQTTSEPVETTTATAAAESLPALQVLALPTAVPANPAAATSQPKIAVAGSDLAYFGLAQLVDEKPEYLGVYRMDLQSGVKTELLGKGYNLQAISPDGSQLLVNKSSELYLSASDGSSPALLTSSFYDQGRQGGFWLPDGKALLFIAQQAGKTLLVYYPLDGSGWKRLTPVEESPVELYFSPLSNQFYYQNSSGEIRSVARDGTLAGILKDVNKPAFSPDGLRLAYTIAKKGDKTSLVIATADRAVETPIENIGDHIIDYAWSPDGQSLSVLALVQSEYSGKWYDIRNLIITPADMGTKILPGISGLNSRTVWSTNGGSLLFSGTDEKDGTYFIKMNLYDLASGTMTNLDEKAGLKSDKFLMMTNIFR